MIKIKKKLFNKLYILSYEHFFKFISSDSWGYMVVNFKVYFLLPPIDGTYHI